MNELDCLNCGCGPHKSKACWSCKTCTKYMRVDFHTAYAVTSINNVLIGELGSIRELLGNIQDLLCEVNPDARDRVEVKRAELRAALQKAEEEKANVNNPPAAPAPSGEAAGSNDPALD